MMELQPSASIVRPPALRRALGWFGSTECPQSGQNRSPSASELPQLEQTRDGFKLATQGLVVAFLGVSPVYRDIYEVRDVCVVVAVGGSEIGADNRPEWEFTVLPSDGLRSR